MSTMLNALDNTEAGITYKGGKGSDTNQWYTAISKGKPGQDHFVPFKGEPSEEGEKAKEKAEKMAEEWKTILAEFQKLYKPTAAEDQPMTECFSKYAYRPSGAKSSPSLNPVYQYLHCCFALFPIRYHEICQMYKIAEACLQTAEKMFGKFRQTACYLLQFFCLDILDEVVLFAPLFISAASMNGKMHMSINQICLPGLTILTNPQSNNGPIVSPIVLSLQPYDLSPVALSGGGDFVAKLTSKLLFKVK
ncbi:hypothetical protein BDP27DRAFT_1366199 [Rhodocollybia butyracea]|uniref:Uncharacterized protein n=1 Tax=Rhodocollybia butyracea TaxID=206335 RepID=A0A9P5U489_9AGAR|nr:hypothetical protein BDP27DRAFT_1366199 [Rhodocollybia butyracea]